MNETLLPVDFETAGMLTDDHIGDLLIKHLPEGVRLTAVLDCCHSGTGLDLPFTWTDAGWREETNPYHSLGDVQLFSGCDDDECSADVASAASAGGAMTTALCEILRTGVCMRYPELLSKLHQAMRSGGFSQRPRLTSSQRFDPGRSFSLHGAVANTNASIGRTVRRRFPPKPRSVSGALSDLGNMLGMAGLGAIAACSVSEATALGSLMW
jgi:hypothetical protein